MSGTLMAIGARKKPGKVDFYPTPSLVTNRLLDSIELPAGPVWEPCCGAGAISKVLINRGISVVSTDLYDHGYGVTGVDATDPEHDAPCGLVLTNPAFSIAAELIKRLYDDPKITWFCLMTKSQFWHAERRTQLFKRTAPHLILALNWRQDPFDAGGSPTMDHIWTVWDKSRTGSTEFRIIEKALA